MASSSRSSSEKSALSKWKAHLRDRKAKKKEDDEEMLLLAAVALSCATGTGSSTEENGATSDDNSPTASKPRKKKRPIAMARDGLGDVVPLSPKMSVWYLTYVQDPSYDNINFLHKFRRRFRSSYPAYLSLLDNVRSDAGEKYFSRWTVETPYQKQSPVELLLLGALRYLGRGWTFDDLEEVTGILEETHRCFFHTFIAFGSSVLYDRYVRVPSSSEEARSKAYEEAGMAGCIGSMDATHVLCERIPHDLGHEHKAFKLPGTSRTYNIVVNNSRRILSTTRGHPARWNDKTLVRYDEIATALHQGDSPLDEHSFTLLERDDSGTVTEVNYRGGWLLVDNGYLAWPCTIPPFTTTDSIAAIRWSKWLESLRKDVECTFGIMKGRFRVLKAGVRLHGIEAADNLWTTCCALHNFFLDMDGLEEDVWTGEEGLFTEVDCYETMPEQLQRLLSPQQQRRFDSSGVGVGMDRVEDDDDDALRLDLSLSPEENRQALRSSAGTDGVRRVRHLPMSVFRDALVEHFDCLFHENKLVWPQTNNS